MILTKSLHCWYKHTSSNTSKFYSKLWTDIFLHLGADYIRGAILVPQRGQVWKYFLTYMTKECIRSINKLNGSTRNILLLFLYIPEANFIAASFRMSYMRMFLLSTGLATNSYDYTRFSVIYGFLLTHLWLTKVNKCSLVKWASSPRWSCPNSYNSKFSL